LFLFSDIIVIAKELKGNAYESKCVFPLLQTNVSESQTDPTEWTLSDALSSVVLTCDNRQNIVYQIQKAIQTRKDSVDNLLGASAE